MTENNDQSFAEEAKLDSMKPELIFMAEAEVLRMAVIHLASGRASKIDRLAFATASYHFSQRVLGFAEEHELPEALVAFAKEVSWAYVAPGSEVEAAAKKLMAQNPSDPVLQALKRQAEGSSPVVADREDQGFGLYL